MINYLGHPDENRGKNAPFTKEEQLKYLANAEGFKDKPYDSKDGYWSIGYGYAFRKKDKDETVYKDKYAYENFEQGITEEKALEFLSKKWNDGVNTAKRVLKANGINYETLPEDVQVAINLFSYGGWLQRSDEEDKNYSKAFVGALKEAEVNGWDKASRYKLASTFRREREDDPNLPGLSNRANIMRSMLAGEHDYDDTRTKLDTKGTLYSKEMGDKYSGYNREALMREDISNDNNRENLLNKLIEDRKKEIEEEKQNSPEQFIRDYGFQYGTKPFNPIEEKTKNDIRLPIKPLF